MVALQQSPFVREMEQTAADQNTTTEKLFNQAVSQFLYRVALKKMKAETATFEQMHDQLVVNYLGHYVAIHKGEVVDHDPDLPTLRRRIRQRFERTPILLREVTHEVKQRDLVIRRPGLTARVYRTY